MGFDSEEGIPLAFTPTWAVATVITLMVSVGFFFQICLEKLGKWLEKAHRKALYSALEKIKDELMLFGVLSLLMGHWIIVFAKICVKSSALSSKFFPCALKDYSRSENRRIMFSASDFMNKSVNLIRRRHDHCPEGHESFASYESLEQLHRLMFALGITHVTYSFVAIVLAMVKIYSWRVWENQAKSMANDTLQASKSTTGIRRLSTFIFRHTSHPWSQHNVLVWLLCFSHQFWSSVSHTDYEALRLGFITNHQLPLAYDFLSYMLRSMEAEFHEIVGIRLPLWIYAICCIFLDFHGTYVYFWLSFLPAILLLLIGTKLHRVVVKLAVEIMNASPDLGHHHQFKLRDDLFWFGKPKLLLWLIQLISFQNAFEMATFLWSLWEIKDPSCFMDNRKFVAARLAFGLITQFWCSFITFPLYVIVAQMGTRPKRSVISEKVWESLQGWLSRAKSRRSSTSTSVTPLLRSTSRSYTSTVS